MLHRATAGLLLTLGLALAPGAAGADDDERRYDVELVIFENTDTGAGERERWRPEVTIPAVEGAIALGQRLAGAGDPVTMARGERLAEMPAGFEPLAAGDTRLGGAVEKLQASERYRVLRHLAWRQPALDREDTLAVRAVHGESLQVRVPITDFEELYALEAAAERGDGSGATAASGADDGDDDGGAKTFGTGPMFQSNRRPLLRTVGIHPLDGTVRVAVSRYLHVYTDLHFTTPVEWTALPQGEADAGADGEAGADAGTQVSAPRIALGPDGRAMLSYPFVQHRRMRSGVLHYLDHPVLGMLIRVDRAPQPGTDEAAADAAAGG